jgi:hypothetical protein
MTMRKRRHFRDAADCPENLESTQIEGRFPVAVTSGLIDRLWRPRYLF